MWPESQNFLQGILKAPYHPQLLDDILADMFSLEGVSSIYYNWFRENNVL